MDKEMQLLLMLGLLSQLSPEEKARTDECAAKIRELVGEYGPEGLLALALAMAEYAIIAEALP